MEQSKDQSSSDLTEGSNSVTVAACKAPKGCHYRVNNQKAAKPKRYKSCEDLSDHRLKQTHHQCWSVFQAFVHVTKKDAATQHTQSAQSSVAADTPSPTEQQRTRQTFRRLRSEPIGCTAQPCGETDGRRQLFRSTDRPSINTNSSIEEEEGETDCIVRSKPLDVVQVRPCSLALETRTSNCSAQYLGTHHTRMPSNSSSDKAPTPASDPPLFSPIGVGVAMPDFLETYPPVRSSREAQLDRSPLQPRPDILVTAGTPESQRHLCCAAASSSSLPVSTGIMCLSLHGCCMEYSRSTVFAYTHINTLFVLAAFTVDYGDSCTWTLWQRGAMCLLVHVTMRC